MIRRHINAYVSPTYLGRLHVTKKGCPSIFLSPEHGVVGHYTVCNGPHALKVI